MHGTMVSHSVYMETQLTHYPCTYLQTPHRTPNLTQAQQDYNKAMSKVRVSVE